MTNKSKSNVLILVALFLAAVMVVSACVPTGPAAPAGDPIEQAMQTLQAQATQDFYATEVARLTAQPTDVVVQPTSTLQINPTNINEVPVNTLPPTVAVTQPVVTQAPATQVPPIPTATRIPPTPTPKPCYQISFVSDVTVPDGTKIIAGTSFTKTWRLQNSGTCKWDTGFDIIFVGGNQMGANKVYDFPKDVAPGGTVDVSIPFVAPLTEGNYTSEWKLQSNNGVQFGTGADTKGPFWVKIQSIDGRGVVYSFANNVCDAKWSSGSKGTLACPGDEKKNDDGYVLTKNNPIREDGGKENEIGLVTRPNDAGNGYVQGIYPAFTIKDGDKFRATIQCEGGSDGCKLKFELYVREPGGKFVEVGEWHEVYDLKWNQIEVDLSAYAGKNLEFSLVVWNDGTSVNNRGLWLNPIIYRTK